MSQSIQEEITAEVKKRIEAKEAQYRKKFNGPSAGTRKRWQKKVVRQVEAEKAQLSFDFM